MTAPDVAARNRRAIGLILLTTILPGAAQYVVGNRGVGRTALRIWGVLVAGALFIGFGLVFWPGPTAEFLLNRAVTGVMRILVWLVFLGWLVLLFDTWRLSRPPNLKRRARLILTGTCAVLAIAAGLGASLLASAFTAAGHVSDVFTGGGDIRARQGRYNILLLGVDAAADREGIRPDSINVASIDAETGRTVVFGLPRNLVGVPFPSSSPLAKLYPDGFRCAEECMLNGVYALGQEHADLYPDGEAGLTAMKEATSETLGLELNYYAMVDLAGFQNLVDAMGGVNLDIGKRVPIGGVGSQIYGWIEAGENVHLDGYHALWFARSRADSDDYERMTRQKCVMAAMAKQLDPGTVAARFVDLAEAGSDMVSTDVGTGQLPELVDLAIRGRGLSIETVNLAPPLIRTSSPDYALIRRTVAESIEASGAGDASDAPTGSSAPAPVSTSPTPTGRAPSPGTGTSGGATGGTSPSPSPTPSSGTPVCRVS